eukprot:6185192-Pleurochrysis_carterae.AAC.5
MVYRRNNNKTHKKWTKTKQLTKTQIWYINNADRVREFQRAHCLKQCYDRISFPYRASLVKYQFTTEKMQDLLNFIQDKLQKQL